MKGETKSYREKLEAIRRQQAAPSPAPPDGVTPLGATEPSAEGDGDAIAGIARRHKRVRLNFIQKDGEEESLPYIQLMPVRFKGGEITLVYPWCVITLKGRNLKRLKRRLDLEIHGTIREVDPLADAAEGNAYAVYEIRKD